MKVGVYDVINDPLPKLYKIKDIEISKNDLEYDETIVSMLNNKLKMDKLSSEHIYALSLTYGMIPKGILQVSIGKCDSADVDVRKLAIGLLLLGTEQFMCFHNHPGGSKKPSLSDNLLTNKYKEIGDLLEIEFIRHLMITKDYYCICEEV